MGIAYDDPLQPPPLGARTVQEALDALKRLVAGGSTAQAYWDQPSVSPMVGALSAIALMSPNPAAKGIVGWQVWFAQPPAESVLLRLYRYRADPYFNYTLIADPYEILPDANWATIIDLTSLLYPDAADFEQSKNDVLALSVLVTGAPDMRALVQRITFGAPTP